MKDFIYKKNSLLILLISLLNIQSLGGQKVFNIASGYWNAAGNWSPAGVPSATDTVTIPGGRSCTVNAAAACASLIIETGAVISVQRSLTVQTTSTVDGTISFTSTQGTKIFCGLVTIGPSGSWINSANEGITFQGGLTNQGLFTSGTGTYIFNNNQAVSGNPITFNGNISITSGRTLTNYTTITVTDNLTGGSSTSRFTNESNAVLKADGTVMTTGEITATSNGNTINYNRRGNQTVKATSYFNLSLSGLGKKTTTGVSVNGELTLQGTARVTAAPTYGPSAVLKYKGNAAQTTGSEFPAVMNIPVIVDNINGVNLNSAKILNDSLILINGNINTTSINLLTMGANGTISGGSSASFINGPLARIKNTAAQQSLHFPLGKNSIYKPVELILTHADATSSTYTAELFNAAPAGRALPSSLDGVSTVRYWNITKTGAAVVSSAFVVLYYDSDDGVTDTDNLRVAKDNGTAWQDLGGTANGSPAGSILSDSLTSFSEFVLANASGGSNPLPVELNSFNAMLKDQEVLLSWITQNEMKNYGFDVERRSPEDSWATICFVKGHGNSNSPKEYSFTDKQLSAGKYFYRLKQIDTDGNFKYSNELEVTVTFVLNEFLLKQNYPNPFNPSTTIEYAIPKESFVELKVYDIIGNELTTLVSEYQPAGKFRAEFNAANLSTGIYIAKLTAGAFTKSMKMTLMK
jgi:hypothetical protein